MHVVDRRGREPSIEEQEAQLAEEEARRRERRRFDEGFAEYERRRWDEALEDAELEDLGLIDPEEEN